MNCGRAARIADRTGGEVIDSRGRVVAYAPYADSHGYDSAYRERRVCVDYDSYGDGLRWGVR